MSAWFLDSDSELSICFQQVRKEKFYYYVFCTKVLNASSFKVHITANNS